jgi:hypothetical protein
LESGKMTPGFQCKGLRIMKCMICFLHKIFIS